MNLENGLSGWVGVRCLFVAVLAGGHLMSCSPSSEGADAPGGSSLDATFLNGTWLSGCDVIGLNSAKYCTTFSGTDSYASRTMFFAGSTSCAGTSVIAPGSGTYALAGAATTPSGASKVDIVIAGVGARYSILARDGSNLKFGKEDATHDGATEIGRYQGFMAQSHTRGTCSF